MIGLLLRCEKNSTITFRYNLITKSLDSSMLSDSTTLDLIEDLRGYWSIMDYLENVKSTPTLAKEPKVVKNLYTVLKIVIDNKCLIALNNFESADIYTTVVYPVVLRRLDLTVGKVT